MKHRQRWLWMGLLVAGMLAPGRALSPLDGIPLNGVGEALLIGLVVPALMWLHPSALDRLWVRTLIAALAIVKIVGFTALPQHGLCARFSTNGPLEGVTATIDINEPQGYLRSFDIRADWRAASPRCTAIFDRAYAERDEFPVWFFNLLNALRPDAPVSLDVEGFVNAGRSGTFSLQIADDMQADGYVGENSIASTQKSLTVPLAAGSHPIRLHARFNGTRWQFAPLWNGRDAFAAGVLTASPPGRLDSVMASPLSWLTTLIVGAIVIGWVGSTLRADLVTLPALIWALVASLTLMIAAATSSRLDRIAPLLLVGAALVPLHRRQQTIRAVFVMVGVPWFALLVARAAPQFGRVTFYSVGDDWHMFQSAGYAIVLNGQWFRGGSAAFVYQAFYRWFAGGLHLVFGDPSPGDILWDAACLLVAAIACFLLVKPVSGFRAALIAAALTLATFTISPIWHLIGRGLSEITAVGWMTLSLPFVLRARLGRLRAAAAGGFLAALMYVTRMDRALVGIFLLAGLLPRRTPAAWRDFFRALRLVRVTSAVVYVLVAVPGVLLLATRTWWYTGHFSPVYGSSFPIQQTGLWPTTIASPAVWAKVAESLAGTLSMREPPAFDPRTVLVVAGALLSALAIVQLPKFNRLPALPALLTCGALAGAFFAHTHEYAGRISIHVVPFAVAMTVCASERLLVAAIER